MKTVLLVLNTLVLGGCTALVLVWQLLTWLFKPNAPSTGRGFSPEHVWETIYPLYQFYVIGPIVVLVATTGYGLLGGLRAQRRSPAKPRRDETSA